MSYGDLDPRRWYEPTLEPPQWKIIDGQFQSPIAQFSFGDTRLVVNNRRYNAPAKAGEGQLVVAAYDIVRNIRVVFIFDTEGASQAINGYIDSSKILVRVPTSGMQELFRNYPDIFSGLAKRDDIRISDEVLENLNEQQRRFTFPELDGPKRTDLEVFYDAIGQLGRAVGVETFGIPTTQEAADIVGLLQLKLPPKFLNVPRTKSSFSMILEACSSQKPMTDQRVIYYLDRLVEFGNAAIRELNGQNPLGRELPTIDFS